MLKAHFKKYTFQFKKPSGTSRGVLLDKDSWFIIVYDVENQAKKGVGECSIIRKLSMDDRPDFELKLQEVVNDINNITYWLEEGLKEFPSIRFGLETALLDLHASAPQILFPSAFTSGKKSIPINGLIWMGDVENMYQQVKEKVAAGFQCIKLKIGAINFEDELMLLKKIRKEFSGHDLELRVDANGAFKPAVAMEKLERLSGFELHSIEQPIKQGQWQEMKRLCEASPIPIAMDEELIGLTEAQAIENMLETIRPQFIILKPGLLGGLQVSESWIEAAEKKKVGWWVTSALESNIGLNAIAQWTYTLKTDMYQGLGTGQLFENNVPSPLYIENAALHYGSQRAWNLNALINES
jgi:o-succinylbenzoate synthase